MANPGGGQSSARTAPETGVTASSGERDKAANARDEVVTTATNAPVEHRPAEAAKVEPVATAKEEAKTTAPTAKEEAAKPSAPTAKEEAAKPSAPTAKEEAPKAAPAPGKILDAVQHESPVQHEPAAASPAPAPASQKTESPAAPAVAQASSATQKDAARQQQQQATNARLDSAYHSQKTLKADLALIAAVAKAKLASNANTERVALKNADKVVGTAAKVMQKSLANPSSAPTAKLKKAAKAVREKADRSTMQSFASAAGNYAGQEMGASRIPPSQSGQEMPASRLPTGASGYDLGVGGRAASRTGTVVDAILAGAGGRRGFASLGDSGRGPPGSGGTVGGGMGRMGSGGGAGGGGGGGGGGEGRGGGRGGIKGLKGKKSGRSVRPVAPRPIESKGSSTKVSLPV